MGEVMKEAAFSLAEAKFTTGDFNQVVLQNVTKAQIKIRTKKDNVAGKKELLSVVWSFFPTCQKYTMLELKMRRNWFVVLSGVYSEISRLTRNRYFGGPLSYLVSDPAIRVLILTYAICWYVHYSLFRESRV